jgi:hypothetical protein
VEGEGLGGAVLEAVSLLAWARPAAWRAARRELGGLCSRI